MPSNLDSTSLAELERQYLAGKIAYLTQKIEKRTEAIRIALGMLGLLLALELYMLSGCWAKDLPELAITLLFVIPLVAMSAIVVIVVIGAFGKEPSVGVGNLADQASEASIGP